MATAPADQPGEILIGTIFGRVKDGTHGHRRIRGVSTDALRFIVASLLTLATAAVGGWIFPDENESKSVTAQAPILSIVSGKSGDSASIDSIYLSNKTALIDFSVTTKVPATTIYVAISGVHFEQDYNQEGWKVSADGTAAFTKLYLRDSGFHGDLHTGVDLVSCGCYQYKKPYLYATLIHYDAWLAAGDASLSVPSWPRKTYPITSSVVHKNQIDLTQVDLPKEWVAIDQFPDAPAHHAENWWIWTDTDYGDFRLSSVDDAAISEHTTFWAGLLLGIAGAGLFVAIDSFLSLWVNRRKRHVGDQVDRDRRDVRSAARRVAVEEIEPTGTETSVGAVVLTTDDTKVPDEGVTDRRKPVWLRAGIMGAGASVGILVVSSALRRYIRRS